MYKSKAKQSKALCTKAKQGTMYKNKAKQSRALCTKGVRHYNVQKQQNIRCTKGEILGKAVKEKIKYVFRGGRTFPKYFSSKSGSVLPGNDFKFPTFKYLYDATVFLNQNQFLSKI